MNIRTTMLWLFLGGGFGLLLVKGIEVWSRVPKATAKLEEARAFLREEITDVSAMASQGMGGSLRFTVSDDGKVLSVEQSYPTTPLDKFLTANPASPIGLLCPEEAEKYLPTKERLMDFYRTIPEFGDMDFDALPYTVDLAYLHQLCLEHKAFRRYCVEYKVRERERWALGLPSVALERELRPVLRFINEQFGYDPEIWGAVNAYSSDAIRQIHGEGTSASTGDDPASQWLLDTVLEQASVLPFDAVAEILRGYQP